MIAFRGLSGCIHLSHDLQSMLVWLIPLSKRGSAVVSWNLWGKRPPQHFFLINWSWRSNLLWNKLLYKDFVVKCEHFWQINAMIYCRLSSVLVWSMDHCMCDGKWFPDPIKNDFPVMKPIAKYEMKTSASSRLTKYLLCQIDFINMTSFRVTSLTWNRFWRIK